MKAVVLDITGKGATVMTHEGDIIGIRNKGYDIGQEIEIKSAGNKAFAKVYRIAPILSAIAAAAVLIFTGVRTYFNPYGTVSLDINPSIEYTINRFDRVLEVNGVNEDGSDILSQINKDSLINKDIEDAVETTIDQIEADGYMADEDGNFVVVSANTRKEEHTDKLLERLDNKVKGRGNIRPMTFKVSDEELNEAHDEGISGGKKKIVDRLEEASGEKIDRSKWRGKSVRDIEEEYDRLKDGRSVDDEKEKESPQTEVMEKPDNEPENKYAPEGSNSKPEDEPGSNDNAIDKNHEPKQEQRWPENRLNENVQEPINNPGKEEHDETQDNHQPANFGDGQGEPPKDSSDNIDSPPMQNNGGFHGEYDNMPPSDGQGSPGGNGDQPQEHGGPGPR